MLWNLERIIMKYNDFICFLIIKYLPKNWNYIGRNSSTTIGIRYILGTQNSIQRWYRSPFRLRELPLPMTCDFEVDCNTNRFLTDVCVDVWISQRGCGPLLIYLFRHRTQSSWKTLHELRWFQIGEPRFSVLHQLRYLLKQSLKLLSITITKTVTTNLHYKCCQTKCIAKILFNPAMMLPILYNIIYQPLVPTIYHYRQIIFICSRR